MPRLTLAHSARAGGKPTLTDTRSARANNSNPAPLSFRAGNSPGGSHPPCRREPLPGLTYMHEITRDHLRRVGDPQQLAEDDLILTAENDTPRWHLSTADILAIIFMTTWFTAVVTASVWSLL